jgi:hypothetical protein
MSNLLGSATNYVAWGLGGLWDKMQVVVTWVMVKIPFVYICIKIVIVVVRWVMRPIRRGNIFAQVLFVLGLNFRNFFRELDNIAAAVAPVPNAPVANNNAINPV